MAYSDIQSRTHNTGTHSSSSSDINFDYAGQGLANQYGNQLSQLRSAQAQSLMDDPLSSVGTSGRIRDLQRYLTAYHTGQQLPDHAVIPGMRVSSISESNSSANSTDDNVHLFDPQRVAIARLQARD